MKQRLTYLFALSITAIVLSVFAGAKKTEAGIFSFILGRSLPAVTDVCFYIQTELFIPLGTCEIGDVDFGAADTQFDITKPYLTNPNICRYTYDGTGTDPDITYDMPGTGAIVVINAQNFSAGNNGYYITTTAVADYFEVTNTSCVAEDDKTIGTGDIGSRIDERAFGGESSQFDITKPSGYLCRYTWDGTGTDPGINKITFKVGDHININGAGFNAGNNGFFNISASGANYFEVVNTGCVAESNKLLGPAGHLKNRGQ